MGHEVGVASCPLSCPLGCPPRGEPVDFQDPRRWCELAPELFPKLSMRGEPVNFPGSEAVVRAVAKTTEPDTSALPGKLGRIINVIGEPIDERGPIGEKMQLPIHAEAPALTDQGSGQEILITGIKVVDLLAPYSTHNFRQVSLIC